MIIFLHMFSIPNIYSEEISFEFIPKKLYEKSIKNILFILFYICLYTYSIQYYYSTKSVILYLNRIL